jgi:hypothetical protein
LFAKILDGPVTPCDFVAVFDDLAAGFALGAGAATASTFGIMIVVPTAREESSILLNEPISLGSVPKDYAMEASVSPFFTV